MLTALSWLVGALSAHWLRRRYWRRALARSERCLRILQRIPPNDNGCEP